MIKSTTDIADDQRGIFALFKGDSGAGKTVAALSFPDPFLFDFDRKMPGIARKHFPGKEIAYDNFNNIFEIADFLNGLQDNCPYETLVSDSITSLTQTCLTSIAQIKGEPTPKMLKQLSAGGKAIEMMSIDYYNGEDRFIKYYLDVMKALWAKPGNPKHVIIIAHVVTSESQPDLRTKLVTRSSSIVTAGRKVAAYIPCQFDEVYHFTIKQSSLGEDNLKHVACTEAFGDNSAKTAYNLPNIIDFTRPKQFYDLIRGQLVPDSHLLPPSERVDPFA